MQGLRTVSGNLPEERCLCCRFHPRPIEESGAGRLDPLIFWIDTGKVNEIMEQGVDEMGFEPKIIAFCCNWCSYAAADLGVRYA